MRVGVAAWPQVADMKNSVKDRNNAQSSCAGTFIHEHLHPEYTGGWLHVDMAGARRAIITTRRAAPGIVGARTVACASSTRPPRYWSHVPSAPRREPGGCR